MPRGIPQLQRQHAELRADIAGRPDDDPTRLRQALRDEQAAHAQDVTRLTAQRAQAEERCNRTQIARAIAEVKLAAVEAALEVALAGT